MEPEICNGHYTNNVPARETGADFHLPKKGEDTRRISFLPKIWTQNRYMVVQLLGAAVATLDREPEVRKTDRIYFV